MFATQQESPPKLNKIQQISITDQAQKMWWVSPDLEMKLFKKILLLYWIAEADKHIVSVSVPTIAGEQQAPARSEELITALCKPGPGTIQRVKKSKQHTRKGGYNLQIHI